MENNTTPKKCKYASINDSWCEKYGLLQWNLGETWAKHCINGGGCERLVAEEQAKQSAEADKKAE